MTNPTGNVLDLNPLFDTMVASLTTKLPDRYVGRSLRTPDDCAAKELLGGVLCVLADGGAMFSRTRGREAQAGQIDFTVVGYVQLTEEKGWAPADIERAELAMVNDVLRWVDELQPGELDLGGKAIYPEAWRGSKQMEAPFGWFVMAVALK